MLLICGVGCMAGEFKVINYFIPPEIRRPLVEAREAWQRREWLITARVMAEVGIDAALDDLQAFMAAVDDFEETFGEQ